MTQVDRPMLPTLDEKSFEAFLTARRPVPPAVSLSGFEGYVTALVVGPRFVDPRRWIPLFAGETAMLAPTGTEDCAAEQSIVATYNRLSAGMAEFPYLYRPRFLLRDDGSADGHPWVAGIFAGTSHAPRLWKPMLNGLPETGNLIAPIRAAIRWRSTPEDIKDVAKAVLAIRDHFMPQRVRAARP